MKYNGHKLYAMFIGRWQPFHKGHKYLVDQALAEGKHVAIAIRDTELSEKNPYTVEQRREMVWRLYGNTVKVIVIPDIESINIGRKVGYEVNRIDAPEEITKISGTNVRAGKDTNVPPEVEEYVKTLRTTLWLTGLPCAGKTTLAKRIKEELDNRGYITTHLDGDDVRGALNEDLGFSEEDRKENLRRVAHVAKLFNKRGTFAIASFVSPTNSLRKMIKKIIGNFKLVYVKCDLEECEKRDVKGMYKRARLGEIQQFTGVSAPFEEPDDANIVIDTKKHDVEECVNAILEALKIISRKRISVQ